MGQGPLSIGIGSVFSSSLSVSFLINSLLHSLLRTLWNSIILRLRPNNNWLRFSNVMQDEM